MDVRGNVVRFPAGQIRCAVQSAYYSMGPGSSFPGRYDGRAVKLTSHFPLVLMLGMRGDANFLSHMPSWRTQGNLYFYDVLFYGTGRCLLNAK